MEDRIKRSKIQLVEASEGKDRKHKEEMVYRKIMAQNFLKLKKGINS